MDNTTLYEMKKKIISFKNIDYDYFEGEPPAEKAYELAYKIADMLPHVEVQKEHTYIFPMLDGGIGFEIRKEGLFFMVDAYNDGTIVVLDGRTHKAAEVGNTDEVYMFLKNELPVKS